VGESIAQFHPDVKRKVRAALDAVRDDPAEGEPLEQELSGFGKIVVGSWRIVYRVEGQVVRVYAVGRRATVYSDLVELLRPRIEERPAPYERRPAGGARSAGRPAAMSPER
jgi:mRNA-degrading endonuclease RelE of RelBE toxin-antitoxin system